MDMQQMMLQAQKMQAELTRAQEDVTQMKFAFTAGGGMVEAVACGDNTIESITINPDVVDPDDVEMLQDLVLAAVNGALEGVAEQGAARMAAVTGGLNIPGLM